MFTPNIHYSEYINYGVLGFWVLTTLAELQREHGGRNVPVIELWGRVVEQVSLSQAELQAILKRLGA